MDHVDAGDFEDFDFGFGDDGVVEDVGVLLRLVLLFLLKVLLLPTREVRIIINSMVLRIIKNNLLPNPAPLRLNSNQITISSSRHVPFINHRRHPFLLINLPIQAYLSQQWIILR